MIGAARQSIVAIYQATVPHDLAWPAGPLPLAVGTLRADAATRSTYYPPRTVRLLYGVPGHPCRWHKEIKVRAGTATVVALEALRLDNRVGMLLAHLAPDDILAACRALAGREDAALNGLDVRQLAPELEISPAPPYTLAFVTPVGRLPRLYGQLRYLRWPASGQWLWALASRTSRADYPPDPEEVSRQDRDALRLSADWKGMILRDGMAFAGTRPDQGSSDTYYGHAALYARSIYADAITLGLLQLRGITDLEEALAGALDTPDGEPIADLQRQLTNFRNRLWWQHLSAHGVPNQILAAFHRQHRLRERFEQILAEINDLSQLMHDTEMSNINNSAVLFTVITVPIGIGLALLQLLGHPGSAVFILVIAACLAVSFLALLTRPGKLAIRSVRRRLTS